MARLVVQPGTLTAWEVELKPGVNTFGRGESNTFKLGDASVSGTQATGPAIRLKSSGTDVLASGSSTGSAPDSGGNTAAGTGSEKTYCLEFHEENGTHLFGWPKSCASLSDSEKGSYTINKEGLTSANPGSRMGFILNKAVLKSFIVTSGKIGTAGSLQ